MIAFQTPVFPCIKTLGWIIDRTDAMKYLVNDENGGCINVFLSTKVHKYYKLRDPEEQLNIDFVVKFYEFHDTSILMASWWNEYKKFTNQSKGWYMTRNVMKPYIYLISLLCRLYGERDCAKFSKAWIPLEYTVAISRSGLNWGSIISKQMSTNTL